jgi:hypothetical protein
MSVMTSKLSLYLEKEPLPLKLSLDALDEEQLAPYKVVAKQKIENADVLQSLGTQDYIQWVLEDPCEPQHSAVHQVLLFVTYYGLADRVPHVPEECYTGGGYQRLETADMRLRSGAPGQSRDIPGRYLLFGPRGGPSTLAAQQFPVLYLFRVDGEYAGNRDDARIALNKNMFRKCSYFCKIELAFNQSSVPPAKRDAVAASEKLLTVLLPLLEQNHWPDQP